MSDQIAFAITLGEDDLVRAFRLNARLGRTGPLFLAILVLVALLALILWWSPQARFSATTRPLTLLLEGAVGIMALLVFSLYAATPWIWRWGARRSLARRGDLSGPVHYAIDADTITRRTEGSLASERLALLGHWREDDHVLLIYLAHGLFYVIPKAQLSQEALDGLRQRLTEAGVTSK